MRKTMGVERPFEKWGLVASALFHIILLGAAILALPAVKALEKATEDSVTVEIISAPEVETAPQTAASNASTSEPVQTLAALPQPDTLPAPQVSEPRDAQPPIVRPSRMLSEQVLSDPRSKNAMRDLAALLPADQVEQLCGLEAMAQVGEWNSELKPDRLVAYAMSDPVMKGHVFTAKGAAFHSKTDWYGIQFKCGLSPDHKKVVAFEFIAGDPIPKSEWSAHNLPDESVALD